MAMAYERTTLSIALFTGGMILVVGCVGPQDPTRISDISVDADATPLKVNVIEASLSENVFDTHTCFGTVKPSSSSYLTFARGGQVAELLKSVGDVVEADEKLATVEQEELIEQQAEIDDSLTKANERLSRLNPNNRSTNVQREIGRLQQEVTTLEERKRDIDREISSRTIVAPYSGIIAEKKTAVGNSVPSGSPIYKIVADEPPIIELNVAARVAESMAVGQELTVENQGQIVQAKVGSKSPELSPSSHTQVVTIEIVDPDPNTTWVYGSTIEARFQNASDAQGFWLPLSALQREVDGLWSAMVVQQPDDHQQVTRRVLELLQLADDHALVQGSLEPGDLVIVDGSSRVVPGQQVTTDTLAYSYQQPGLPGQSE